MCRTNPDHYYSGHLTQCPWCQRAQNRAKSPARTPTQPSLQTPLPPAPSSQPSIPARAPTPARLSVPAWIAALTAQPTRAAQLTPANPIPVPAPPVPVPLFPAQGARFVTARRLVRSARTGARRFFYSPKGYLNGRIWWNEMWKYALCGVGAGLGLFLLIFLIFWFPILVGYIAGLLTAGLIGASIVLIAQRVNRQHFRQARAAAFSILVLGGALAVFLGIHVAKLVGASLSAWWPRLGVLALDCFLIGILDGTAYGNYKTLSRRKGMALASITSLLMALSPFAIIAILKLLGLPLPL